MTEPRLEAGAPAAGRAGSRAGPPAALTIALAPAAGRPELPAGQHALAVITYGEPGPAPEPAASSTERGEGLSFHVRLPQVGGPRWRELWSTPEEPVAGEGAGSLRFARTGELLAGALERPGDAPEEEAHDAYRRLLELAARHGFHLVRTWNVVPRLHGARAPAGGPPELDRYMQFCRGRSRAFEDHHGAGFERHLCASSAVGAEDGPLLVHFLATRAPGEHRENRRQLSAYRYPARYGPRSPSFARATLGPGALGRALLISGTASIVGHESLHPGDLGAQTAETLRNLRALLGCRPDARLAERLSMVKVYLRDAGGYATVRRLLRAELGRELPLLFLRADVCRPELLVEIEGVGAPERG